jgi:hypothetical protein
MASSVVVKDVAALEQFAGRLSHSRAQLDQVARELVGALGAVSSSWQDPQREKCAKEIEALVKAMRGFADAAEKQVVYCKSLASKVRSLP